MLTTVRTLAALLLATGGLALAPSPAGAHTGLLSSTPVAGSRVAMSVDRVSLTFSDALVVDASAVAVTGPDGTDVTTTRPDVAGAVVEVRVELAEPGRHVVDYRVVARDGHVESGSLWFTAIAAERPAASDGDGAEGAEGAEDAANEPAERPDAAAASGGSGGSSGGDDAAPLAASRATPSGTPVLPWVLGLGGGGLLVLGLWRVAGRRTGRESG